MTLRSALTPPVPPAPPQHLNALDGWRVVAAAAVLVANVGGVTGLVFNGTPVSWVATRGDIGVAIFFALSGLLLYQPWAAATLGAQDPPAVRAYLTRRALRILPAYWIVVAIAMLTLNQTHARSTWTWTQHLLLLQNYAAHPWWSGTGADGLGQMWSLVVDVSFYLLLPVLAVMLAAIARFGNPDAGTRARRLLIGIAALAASSYGFLALAYRPGSGMPLLGSTLPAFMTWFAAGMALGVVSAWARAEPDGNEPIRVLSRTLASSAVPCLLVAGLLFVIACTPAAGPENFSIPSLWAAEIKTALYTVIAGAVIAPAAFQPATGSRSSSVHGNPVMRFLARISYGFFLWEGIVVIGILAVLHRRSALNGGSFTMLDTAALLVATLAVTVLAATISSYLVERPALRLSGPTVRPPDAVAGEAIEPRWPRPNSGS